MTTCDDIYIDLLNRIIENEESLYGELAFQIARRVSTLEISDQGKVLKISDSPVNIIRALMAEYEKFDGTLSKRFIEGILSAYKSQHPDIELP